uniref:Uncharacterized protein TCIL3000_7_490 n=1 Tax=Trypanosoma congolense (strain IL3000) TaxID=1068625 RepID=G0UPD9_TRYCI|nr:unnamed protein product [Trypanosoma congolense IL3000]
MLGLLRHATESSRSPVAGTGASQLIYANALKEHIQQRMVVIPAAARRTLVTSTSLSTYRLTLHGVALHGPYEQVARVFVAKSTSIELLVLITAVLVVGVFAALELGLRKTYRVLISTEGEEADVGGSTSNWGHGD